MIDKSSPLKNVPISLDHRQAVFIDSIRHMAEMFNLAYMRLCKGLSQVLDRSASGRGEGYYSIYLDAWSFVDSVHRFKLLWKLQPGAESIPWNYSPRLLDKKLEGITRLRNISSHLAQRVDTILANKSSPMGTISWLLMTNRNPVEVKTCLIRPGVVFGNTTEQFVFPGEDDFFCCEVGHIKLAVGKESVDLTDAYLMAFGVVKFAELVLAEKFKNIGGQGCLKNDILAYADLDIK